MAVKQSTKELYKTLLSGFPGKSTFKGLRTYMDGFTPDDGYDLQNFAHWTKHQRAKVRHAYRIIVKLRSQPHHVFRARNPENLKVAQEISHDELNLKGLKVAFVKYSPPRSDPTLKPKIVIKRDTMTVVGKNYKRRFIPFDPLELATNFEREMERVEIEAGVNDGEKHITLQCGAYEKATALMDFGIMAKTVKEYMNKYDGASIPKTKVKLAADFKWRAKDHEWSKWLHGINVYQFAQGAHSMSYMRDSSAARQLNKLAQKRDRKGFLKMKRKLSKGKNRG